MLLQPLDAVFHRGSGYDKWKNMAYCDRRLWISMLQELNLAGIVASVRVDRLKVLLFGYLCRAQAVFLPAGDRDNRFLLGTTRSRTLSLRRTGFDLGTGISRLLITATTVEIDQDQAFGTSYCMADIRAHNMPILRRWCSS